MIGAIYRAGVALRESGERWGIVAIRNIGARVVAWASAR